MTTLSALLDERGWKGTAAPKPYPEELREDVVRVARDRRDGMTLEQVFVDFGVHTVMLSKWLRVEAVEDCAKPGMRRAV